MANYKIWDHWAGKYEKLWVQKYSLTPTRKAILKEISPVLTRHRKFRILDVGCGTGQMLREILWQFAGYDLDLTGIDISPKMIEEARKRSNGINFYCIGVDDFVGDPEGYDVIICSHSLPYYPNKRATVHKFFEMLKEDGVLYLAQASQNSFYDTLVMSFVKLTTSKADYPSLDEMNKVLGKWFAETRYVLIKEKAYMPSIYLFVAKKSEG